MKTYRKVKESLKTQEELSIIDQVQTEKHCKTCISFHKVIEPVVKLFIGDQETFRSTANLPVPSRIFLLIGMSKFKAALRIESENSKGAV